MVDGTEWVPGPRSVLVDMGDRAALVEALAVERWSGVVEDARPESVAGRRYWMQECSQRRGLLRVLTLTVGWSSQVQVEECSSRLQLVLA